MSASPSNMYGLALQTYALPGNVFYTADATGLIANVAEGDVAALVDRGCMSEAQWVKTQAANPGSAAITVTDGTTTVDPATTLSFSGATVTDAGGGVADVAVAGGGLTGWTSTLNTSAPNDSVNASELAASGGITTSLLLLAVW